MNNVIRFHTPYSIISQHASCIHVLFVYYTYILLHAFALAVYKYFTQIMYIRNGQGEKWLDSQHQNHATRAKHTSNKENMRYIINNCARPHAYIETKLL